MKKSNPRFAAAADSARGDFRAFLSRLYKKDYSRCNNNGAYIRICDGDIIDNKTALDRIDRRTLESFGIYFISNTAPEYVFRMFEGNAPARERVNVARRC